jgi:hypothetical protein
MRDEVTGKLRKLHNVELNDLYSLTNIIRVIISKRMRWARHVARMGVRSGVYRENLRERNHLGDRCVDGRIILRWTSWSVMWGYRLD